MVKPIFNFYQIINVNDYKQRYNNRTDEQITYLMIMKLLNRNEIILEIIHLTTNHFCGCVGTELFTEFDRDTIMMIKNNDLP